MAIDSQAMRAVPSQQRVDGIQQLVARFRGHRALTLRSFQRLLGMLTSAASLIPLGLLALRPFQIWLNSLGLHHMRHRHRLVRVTTSCRRFLHPWRRRKYLTQGVPLGAIPSRVVTTDVSQMGWGAVWQRQTARGRWSPQQKRQHINVLELRAVLLALRHFLPALVGRHVLVRSDNMSAVYYINHQGGTKSLQCLGVAQQLLQETHQHLLSLRAVYLPGTYNRAADLLSPGEPRPRGMETPSRCGTGGMGSIWQGRGGPFRLSRIDSVFPLVQPLGARPARPGRTGAYMAETAAIRFSSSATNLAHLAQVGNRGARAATNRSPVAGEGMVPQVAPAVARETLVPPSEEGSTIAAGRPDLASRSVSATALGLAPEGPDPLLGLCEQAVVFTINSSRAPSTNALYANRWKIFTEWCQARGQEPAHCPLPVVLQFLQSLLVRGLTPSTIRVYAAAISAGHVRIEGRTIGSHTLVTRFLKGALRLRPPQRRQVPQWDLLLVLRALCAAPFEPLQTTELSWLSMKTAFLLAITSTKRVGELHALSVGTDCLQWHPEGKGVTLWPNPAFLPKTLPSTFSNQPLSLAAFESTLAEKQGLSAGLWCPVRTLRTSAARTAACRQSDALFVCHTGPRRGQALSRQRLSKWIAETIQQAYRHSGSPAPQQVRAHSTRSVAASWASLRGVPLSDICKAASWASGCTFTRFYRVNVVSHNPVAAAILPTPLRRL